MPSYARRAHPAPHRGLVGQPALVRMEAATVSRMYEWARDEAGLVSVDVVDMVRARKPDVVVAGGHDAHVAQMVHGLAIRGAAAAAAQHARAALDATRWPGSRLCPRPSRRSVSADERRYGPSMPRSTIRCGA